ncbi:DinB family protein [Crossiella sp. SN42]|uniref:DinB family protein n=1 Tax=Crossiella sp. SN42 TaxID=2944808 RepID=UPI00207C4CA1|nr:DinB family protein [Crossiella sp. SN42]MCO1576111.1 DinB family protein [Crossiella sp. SN42]
MTQGERASGFAWSNMFVRPEEDPRSYDGYSPDERVVLAGYLRDQRLTLELKCSGLDAEQLARRAVPPSGLSLLGLVRHLADMERFWFRRVLAGEQVPWLYRRAECRDADFEEAVADPAVVARAWADWRAEVEYAEGFLAGCGDLGAELVDADGESTSVREVVIHVIEEYARHMGHADLLRELIDGRLGQ